TWSTAAVTSSEVPGAALLLITRISSTTSVAAKSRMAARIESRSLYVGRTTEMRLPRHDTPLRLSAEPPAQAIAADEALLDAITDFPLERWWIPSVPAVVVGLGLHQRLTSVIDLDRCRSAGVEVLTRRAGGGAVLLK